MFTKLTKFLVHWSFKIQPIINETLLPVNCIEPRKITTDFDKELRRIKTKFLHADCPAKLINDTFFRFNEKKRRTVNTEMVI